MSSSGRQDGSGRWLLVDVVVYAYNYVPQGLLLSGALLAIAECVCLLGEGEDAQQQEDAQQFSYCAYVRMCNWCT